VKISILGAGVMKYFLNLDRKVFGVELINMKDQTDKFVMMHLTHKCGVLLAVVIT
jgi:hypothetical protein